jgi:integrase
LAEPELVCRVLTTCDESELGRRDEAIFRVLWNTGMRRVSLLSMRLAQIRRERDGFVAWVIGKRGKRLRVLLKGRAADALEQWLGILKAAKITRGPIWLTPRGQPMTPRDVSRMIDLRLEQIGEEAGTLTPHQFRVSFLTLNPAGLDAKQDAAGHSDPKTTRGYDRKSWRGLEAFKAMPEVEDAATEDVS